jgi:mannose-6-phosphate isomerase-like protein (cupin superfamily)
MTISRLSQLTGISGPQLSRIENGKTSAPVSTLNTIVKVLGTKLGFLFDEEEDNDAAVVVTKKDARITSRKGMHEYGYSYEALAFHKRTKSMEPFFITVEKEKSGESVVFNHPGEEFLFMLKGEMVFTHGGEKYYLEEGDCVYFESAVDHWIKNVGKTDLELLMVMVTP